jgi:fimbrial chaperone protein
MNRLRILLVMYCMLLPATVSAGAFTISPVRIELSPRAPMVAVTVRNNDESASASIQTQTMLWKQQDGLDNYEVSRALVVSPPIFTLQPGAEQVVRIALRGAPPADTEALYRVYFQELPGTVEDPATQERRPSLRVVLRMGVPVVVTPASGKSAAKPSLRMERTPSGKQRVIVQNDGNGHLRVTDLVVADATSGAELLKGTSFYVLPGQWWASSEFPIADGASGGGVRVTASTNTGGIDAAMVPGAP